MVSVGDSLHSPCPYRVSYISLRTWCALTFHNMHAIVRDFEYRAVVMLSADLKIHKQIVAASWKMWSVSVYSRDCIEVRLDLSN